jgi:hypothetical protein
MGTTAKIINNKVIDKDLESSLNDKSMLFNNNDITLNDLVGKSPQGASQNSKTNGGLREALSNQNLMI